MSLVMVSVAPADFVGSAWLVAVTCTVAGVGRSAGAVYAPVELIVPTVAFPPATPFTLQLTLVFVEFWTVAWNAAGLPSSTVPLAGVIVTMRGGDFVALRGLWSLSPPAANDLSLVQFRPNLELSSRESVSIWESSARHPALH